MRFFLFAVFCLFAFCSPVFCFSISGVTGDLDNGSDITISGASFGSHPDYNSGKRWLNAFWTDFEDGDIDAGNQLQIENGYTSEWSVSSSSNKTNSTKNALRNYVATRLATLQFIQNSNSTGKLFISCWFRSDSPANKGKTIRAYFGPNSGRDNWYTAAGTNGLQFTATSESFGDPQKTYFGSTYSSNTWLHKMIVANYTGSKSTSTVKFYVNNTRQFTDYTTYAVNNSSIDTGWYDDTINASAFNANGRSINFGALDPETGDWRYDDIYIDYTLARVVIGVNSNDVSGTTFENATHVEILLPIAWASGQVVAQVNTGTFVDGNTAFLWVVDSNQNVSDQNAVANGSQGYQITIGDPGGGVGGDTSAPTFSNESPLDGATGISLTNDPYFYWTTLDNVGVTSYGITMQQNGGTEYLIPSADISTTGNNHSVALADIPFTPLNDATISIDLTARDAASNSGSKTIEFTHVSPPPTPASDVFYDAKSTTTGTRANYTELNSSRWDTFEESGNVVDSIFTTDYSGQSGDRLGEYAVYAGATYTDFQAVGKIRSNDNLSTNAFADYQFVYDYVDADNFKGIEISNFNNSSYFYEVVSGVVTEGDKVYVPGDWITDNNFATFVLTAQNQTISLLLNGQQVGSTSAFGLSGGKVGFGSYNDSMSVDDIEIADLSTPSPPTPPTPAPTTRIAQLSGAGKTIAGGPGLCEVA